MSSAFEKNKSAIKAITGDESLSELIKSYKIGILSNNESFASGKLIAKSLGEYLGRFWHNLDVTGIYSDIFLENAKQSATSCQFDSKIQQQWIPPYDFVICIGTSLPEHTIGISIGADGWKINTGNNVSLSDDPNPVGPFFASALASAQIFKILFQKNIPVESLPIPDNYEWNSWYGNFENNLQNLDLVFDEIHVFGVGAVTHAFFWILQNWPGKIRGTVHLIDPDNYDEGNPQRYLGTVVDDIGKSKTETMMQKMKKICPELNIISHKTDMNNYFLNENPECNVRFAICGLDSKSGRRHLALKLPQKIVNMWTSEYHVGTSRFYFENDWPCLYCAYPESLEKIPDETGLIHKEMKLPPSRIRDLLFSGMGITDSDAKIISQTLGIDPKSILGKPIRSIRSEMCATGKLVMPQNTDESHVPLSFVSGIAGIVGFIETLREIKNVSTTPGQFQMSMLKYPTTHSWSSRIKNPNCYLCSDIALQKIIEEKFG